MLKIKSFTRFHKIGFMFAIIAFMGVAAFGQPDKKLALAQKENSAKLRDYNWKSRTEVRKDNEVKSVQLYLMRYDIDGTQQQTLLSGTQPDIPTKGLRGLIAKKKKEDFVTMLEELGALAKLYGNLPSDKMRRFMVNAVFMPEKSLTRNLIYIRGRDVLEPGDSMTIWIDAVTRKQHKVEIQTYYDTHRVRIVSEFQDLPNGLTYMARSIIDYPTEELTITTENFDYTRKQ